MFQSSSNVALRESKHTSAASVIVTKVGASANSADTGTNTITAIWTILKGGGPAASVPSGTGVAIGTDSVYTWANAGDAARTSLGKSTTAAQISSRVAGKANTTYSIDTATSAGRPIWARA